MLFVDEIMRIIAFICLTFFAIGCGSKITGQHKILNDASGSNRFQDSLAFQLCQMFGHDQGVRPHKAGDKIDWDLIQRTDSVSFKKLVDFVKDNGFPNEKLLGKENFSHECVNSAAIAILLHNPDVLVKEKEYFDLFLNEVTKGNLKAQLLANILDKYYWSKKGNNKHVLYGGAFGMPCKEDKYASNEARKVLGLEPLADSLFVDCN